MAEILASWLNEEVGLSRVSIVPLWPKQMPDSNPIYVCNSKYKTSRKTFLADTCLVSSYGSSTSSQTSKNFLKSKCLTPNNNCYDGVAANLANCRYKFENYCIIGTPFHTGCRTLKSWSLPWETWTLSLTRRWWTRSWNVREASHSGFSTSWKWSLKRFTL